MPAWSGFTWPGAACAALSRAPRMPDAASNDSQADTALLAAARQNLASAAGRHAGAEAQFADAFDFRGLPKLLHDQVALLATPGKQGHERRLSY